MAKKTPQNRYGIKVNDIFVEHWTSADMDNYYFYQVTALKGETMVKVRRIDKDTVAFDGLYGKVVPLPDKWVGEEELVRKVTIYSRGPCIKISSSWQSISHLFEEEKTYLEWHGGGMHFPNLLKEGAPELAKQLDLKSGSGIFFDGGRTIIRYPDGKEEEVNLKELLRPALKKRGY